MIRCPTGVTTAPPPCRPPAADVTAGCCRAALICSTKSHARRYDIPTLRAAADIEPVSWIASKSAIFPGPIRSPLVRSRRILRRVSDMTCGHQLSPHKEHPETIANVNRPGHSIMAAWAREEMRRPLIPSGRDERSLPYRARPNARGYAHRRGSKFPYGVVTLNQRVQGSNPCAPTTSISTSY